MFDNWTFGRRLAVGFGLACVTLVVIAAVAFRLINGLIENDRQLTHTYAVRQNLAQLSSELKDAETGQRGYLITGEDTYLEPYQTALAQVGATLDELRRLNVDSPDQLQRLAALSPLVQAKFVELKQTLDVRRSQGLEVAAKIVQTNSGKSSMDQIRTLLIAADGEEAALLVQRAPTTQASAQWAIDIILGGGLAGVITVCLIGWFITRALSRQIGAAVSHVQSSSTELQAGADQQATGLKEHVSSMSEINTRISELLATSRQIAESAQRVAQISEQTTTATRSGDGTVERANESITGIRRQVDLVVGHMLELGKKSQQIGFVLDIVTELAEQTNILSINATIEAAGAGESGRRFAVVADEIRKLADRVASSVKEIRTLIEDVRASVNTTVMATETGSKSVDTGSQQFGNVTTVFKQIAKLVITTAEAAREIELSTKQQATAVEQINIVVASVAQATRETEASAGQTLQTASELAKTSRDLLRLVQVRSAA